MSEQGTSGFSAAEREAMKQRTKELAAEKRGSQKRSKGEQDVLKALNAMSGSDKEIGLKIHEMVREVAPHLWPKTWYGMPAYAVDGKKVLCFYTSAEKGEARYATFGFNDIAQLDDGNMWPASFAIVQVTDVESTFLKNLLTKAVGSDS